MSVADALIELSAGRREIALELCRRVVPSSPLAAHLAVHLEKPASSGVYVDPDAFERFISGGSNVELYAATIKALADLNDRRSPVSLLDVGCGDGRVTEATTPRSCQRLDLLEPSLAMLDAARDRFDGDSLAVGTNSATLQELMAERPRRSWDAVQCTFALHNLSPEDRRETLPLLASCTDSLAVVEFDVPRFADRSREHATHASEAYETGLAEYCDDPIVIDDFLVPVLVGQFAPDEPRYTFEQPAAAWVTEFEHAGFTSVSVSPVCSYWWADAVLIHGSRG